MTHHRCMQDFPWALKDFSFLFAKNFQRIPKVLVTIWENRCLLSNDGLFPGSLYRIIMPRNFQSQRLLPFFNFRENALHLV
jgi:hypothetical protein